LGQGTITTIAGTNVCGFSGDNGPATQAAVCNPTAVTVDFAGRTYFVDANNGRIRKIDGGTITTIATIGTVTQLVESSGMLWFGDRDAHKILHLRYDGSIQAFGTGAAVSSGDGEYWNAASFNQPSGITMYEAGGSSGFYVADAADGLVRKIDSLTGIVSTVVGPGTGILGDGGPGTAASLISPGAIVILNNALYIADTGHHRIRKLDLATGIITTFAGNGVGGFSGDGGPATAAQLLSPSHIVFDPSGNLYVSDAGNFRVRKIDTTGTISTYAGNGFSAQGADNVPLTQTSFVSVAGVGWNPVSQALEIADGSHRIRLADPREPSTTNLSFSANPALPGDNVTISANVTPTAATGTVTFSITGFAYSQTLGPFALTNGLASTNWLPPNGTFTVTASYSGDAIYSPSTQTGTEVVQRANTTMSLSSSLNPANTDQAVTFTATVAPSGATGVIHFVFVYNNASASYSAPIVNGVAVFPVASMLPGTTSVTAAFDGDLRYNQSQSSPLIQQVRRPTTTSLQVSPFTPTVFGTPVVLTAEIIPSYATGMVNFYDGSTLLGTSPISPSQTSLATATLTVSNLSIGSHTLTASIVESTDYAASTSLPGGHDVLPSTSTTTLSVSPDPSTVGQSVTLTAAVTPATATGTVQFFNGAALLGSAALSAGQAQFNTAALPVGSNSLTATYGGDASNAASTSAVTTQTVNKTPSTAALSASSTTPALGQAVILTATVAPESATGTVSFFQGATLLGTAALTSGNAAFSWTPAGAGNFSVTASYAGDASHLTSTSPATAITVQKAASATTLTSSLNPSVAGAAVTFTATVSPATASGTVLFTSTGASGNITLGTGTVISGVASITSSALPAGVSNVSAQYSGDANYNPSSAAPVAQTVTAVTTTTLTTTPNSSTYGQSVTLRATISPSNATGAVQFFQGATLVGTASVSAGIAQLVTATLPAGTLSLTASYSGNATNAASTSAPKSFVVAKANTTTTLSANPSTSRSGQNVTFTATVAPSAASGTVQFKDGSNVLATVPVSNGTAVFATSSLSVGTHSMRAVYSGGSNHNSSQSSLLNYRVKP
jgi:hypothetical protein